MSENGQYLTALDIAKTIIEVCDSKAEAKQVLDLVGRLIEVRWAISQLTS
jgi:hypothetical protein